MSMIIAWITNIILLILFATVLELLLPNTKMQRYVKLVVGLMLLMVMLQPILSIFQTDPEEWLSDISEWTDNQSDRETTLIESKKKDIEEVQLAYISEQVAVQLKNEAAEEIKLRYEVVLSEVSINYDGFPENEEDLLDKLTGVYVLLQHSSEEEDKERIKIVKIDPVEIKKETSLDEKENSDESSRAIQAFLAEFWALPEDKIHVHMKGGEE